MVWGFRVKRKCQQKQHTDEELGLAELLEVCKREGRQEATKAGRQAGRKEGGREGGGRKGTGVVINLQRPPRSVDCLP